jgi:hypothetical protein
MEDLSIFYPQESVMAQDIQNNLCVWDIDISLSDQIQALD